MASGIPRLKRCVGGGGKMSYPPIASLIVLLVMSLCFYGCGHSPSGSILNNDTPEGAARCWLKSMEFVDGDPEKGRDFELFVKVADPQLFKDTNGEQIPDEELEDLRKKWNSREWEIEFFDLQLETVYNGENEATVKIVGGRARYIGSMFGTTEYQVDDFGKRSGEIFLRKMSGGWRVIGARTVQPTSPEIQPQF